MAGREYLFFALLARTAFGFFIKLSVSLSMSSLPFCLPLILFYFLFFLKIPLPQDRGVSKGRMGVWLLARVNSLHYCTLLLSIFDQDLLGIVIMLAFSFTLSSLSH